MTGKVEPSSPDEQIRRQKRLEDLEAKAVAEAKASADASFRPSPSLLNAASAEALMAQVDGPKLSTYEAKESVYVGRSVPVGKQETLLSFFLVQPAVHACTVVKVVTVFSPFSYLSAITAAGGKLEVPIEVTCSGSVVEYFIEIAKYDLAVTITAERDEGVTIVKVRNDGSFTTVWLSPA